jgi:hypothetical protein
MRFSLGRGLVDDIAHAVSRSERCLPCEAGAQLLGGRLGQAGDREQLDLTGEALRVVAFLDRGL